jgi:excisionase family DNA binding protein
MNILTAREAQEKLRISYPTLRRLIALGLPVLQIKKGNKMLFTDEAIDTWVKKSMKAKRVKCFGH